MPERELNNPSQSPKKKGRTVISRNCRASQSVVNDPALPRTSYRLVVVIRPTLATPACDSLRPITSSACPAFDSRSSFRSFPIRRLRVAADLGPPFPVRSLSVTTSPQVGGRPCRRWRATAAEDCLGDLTPVACGDATSFHVDGTARVLHVGAGRLDNGLLELGHGHQLRQKNVPRTCQIDWHDTVFRGRRGS